jgi:enoyl-CoA hydratase/carnithine racemase
VLDGRPIDGVAAFRLGLTHRLVEPGEALGEALRWAEWLASRPAGALAACKRAVKGARGLPFDDALRHEGAVFIELLSRSETIDGLRQAQARYDDGADTHAAFGIPRT